MFVACACACVSTHGFTYRDQSRISSVLVHITLSLTALRRGLSWKPLFWLAGWLMSSQNLLISGPPCWGLRHEQQCLAFSVPARGLTSGLMLSPAELFPVLFI